MKTKSSFLRSLLTVFLGIAQIAPFSALQIPLLNIPLAGAPIVQAAIPTTIGYQGRLKNASGTPQTGAFSFTFRVYASSTGGVALWSETQSSVSVDQGSFAVALGSVTPFPVSLDFNQPLFLTTEVNADGEMSPRITINTVPYAYTAGGVNSFDVSPSSATGGRMYYDTTNGSLNYYDGVSGLWKSLSSASGSSFTNVGWTNATGSSLSVTTLSFGTASGTNLTWTNGTGANTTSTNLFVVNGTATNLVSTNSTSTNLFATNGTIVNLNATNATTTNFSATNATVSNLTVSNLTVSSTSPSSFANLIWTNATGTNTTSTNLFATSLTATNGNISSLTATSGTVSTLTVPTLSFTNALGTNTTSTNSFASNSSFTNGTSTSWFGFNVASGTSLFASSVQVNGSSVCLQNGTNCPALNSATQTLASVTANGATTSQQLSLFGGFVAASSTVTSTFTVLGNTALQNTTFTNATATSVTSTNLAVLGHVSTDLIPSIDAVLSLGSSAFRWNGSFGTVTTTNLFATSGSITNLSFANATGTGLTVSNGSFTTLSATTGTITNVIAGTVSSTNILATNTTSTHFSATNGSIANVTSTNTFATNSSATNLTATNATLTNLTVSNLNVSGTAPSSFANLTWTNATGTNTTSTNLFVTNGVATNATLTNGTSTNFFTTNGTVTNLAFTNGTSTSWFGFAVASGTTVIASTGNITDLTSSNASITGGSINGTPIGNLIPSTGVFTNVTSTSATSTNLFATNGNISNLTVSNLVVSSTAPSSFTNIVWVNATGTNTTSTNLFVSGTASTTQLFANAGTVGSLTAGSASLGSLTFANGTSTSWFGFNTASGSSVFASSVLVNGTSVCLQNGTNCPSGTATDTLQSVTAQGASTVNQVFLYGGFTAASSTVTSSFTVVGNTSLQDTTLTNATATSVTSTNLFATNGAFTNLSVGSLDLTNLTWVNATGTNTTSTNLAVLGHVSTDLIPSIDAALSLGSSALRWNGNFGSVTTTNLIATNGTFVTLSATTGTFTDLAATNFNASSATIATINNSTLNGGDATFSNVTTTNLAATNETVTNLTASNATLTNLAVTNLTVSSSAPSSFANLIWTNATGTNTTSTNLFVTNGQATNLSVTNETVTDGSVSNLTFTNGTSTSWFGFTAASGTSLFTSSLMVAGRNVCLTDGTNCPSGTATDTLATVTAQGASTVVQLYLFGGFTAASSTVTSTFTVLGDTSLQNTTLINATATSVTTTNLAVLGHVSANLIPSVDASLSLGSSLLRWNAEFASVTSSDIVATNATISNLSFTNGTGTNLFVTNGSFGTLSATTGTFTDLTATNGSFTNATTTNFAASFVSTTQLVVNGQTISAGVPATTATLQTITNNGATTSNPIVAYGGLTTSNLTATGTTSLQALTFTNGTGTSVTTTNLFASNGAFTNLTVGSLALTNLTWVNATGTNVTSTNLAVLGHVSTDLIPSVDAALSLGSAALRWNGNFGSVTTTNLVATTGAFTTLSATTGTFTNLSTTSFNASSATIATINNSTLNGGNATFSNVTATNFAATNETVTNLTAATATVTNLSVSNLTVSSTAPSSFANLIWTNATGTNTTSTNLFVTNGQATNFTTTNGTVSNLSFANGTSTSWLGFNVASGTSLFASSVQVGGVAVCLQNGTNCPSGTATDTLQTVTTQGASTVSQLYLYGGFVAASSTVTSTFTVLGETSLQNVTAANATATNVTSTNLAVLGHVSTDVIPSVDASLSLGSSLLRWNAELASVTSSNLTATNGSISNLTFTNGTGTNLFVSSFVANSGAFTTMSATTGTFTDLSATHLTATNGSFTNATATNFAASFVSTTQLVVGGQAITGGVPATTASLQTITNNGATTSNPIVAFGGLTTSALTATGTAALQALTFTNGTGTSVTTTNLFATSGAFTNLSVGSLNLTNLTWVNATGTNTTSTNLFVTNGQATNLSVTNETVTNGTVSNLTFTNGTSTSWLGFNTATGTSLSALSGSISTLTAPILVSSNATISGGSINGTPIGNTSPSTGVFTAVSSTNATTTNLFVSGVASTTQLFANAETVGALTAGAASISDLTFANGTSTSWFGFSTASGTNLFASAIQVNGSSVCLQNGTNCPAASAETLATVSARGSFATTTLQLYGGFTAASSTVTSSFTVVGNTSLQNTTLTNATATNVTSTNLFATTGAFTNLTVGSLALTNLTWVNATGTNVTSTNLAVLGHVSTDLIPSVDAALSLGSAALRWNGQFGTVTTTNLFATNGSFTTLSATTGTFSDLSTTNFNASSATITTINNSTLNGGNATFSNVTSTNAAATNLIATNATITSLVINGTAPSSFTNLIWTNATGTNTTSTNLFVTNGQATNFSIANGTSTSWFGFATASGSVLNALSGNISSLTAPIFVSSNASISGGSVNGTTIGGINPSTGVFTNVTSTNATTTNLFVSGVASTTQLFANSATISALTAGSGSFSTLTAAQSTSTIFAFTSASGSSLLVSGQSVCLQNGTNCPSSSASAPDWTYDNTSLFIRPATSTNDVVIGSTASATAPFYFDVSSTTSTFQIGRNGNANLLVGTSTYGGGLNTLFVLDGDDTFIQGNLGVASSVYSNGTYNVGTSTVYGRNSLTNATGDYTVSSTNGGSLYLQPNANGKVHIGGTATPQARLTVGDGTSGADIGANYVISLNEATNRSAMAFVNSGGSLGEIGVGFYSSVESQIVGTVTTMPLFLEANNALVMRIDQNSNVGIGMTATLSPRTKLEVQGAVSSTGGLFVGRNNVSDIGSPTSSWRNVYASGTNSFFAGLNFTNLSGANATATRLAFTNASGSTLTLGGQSVCLANGVNCPAGSLTWTDDNTSNFIRPATATRDVIIGATASATAPFYFDVSSTTSTLQIGRSGNANLLVGTSTYGGGLGSLFVMNGDDAFIQGNLGVASSVYTNGAFVAGAGGSSTYYGGNFLTSSASELVFEQTGDSLGTTRFRLQSRFGSTGAIFEQGNAALDLIDFGFKIPSRQSNIRLEARPGSTLFGQKNEFQYLINATDTGTFIQFAVASSNAAFQVPLSINTTQSPFMLSVSGTIGPILNNTNDIGSASSSFRDIYASGTARLGTVSTTQLFVNGKRACLEDGTNCQVPNVKSASTTSDVVLTGTPQAIVTVTSTPRSVSNQLWITVAAEYIGSAGAQTISYSIRRGATCAAGTIVGATISDTMDNATGLTTTFVPGSKNVAISFVDSPATTTAVTYILCASTSAGSPTSDSAQMVVEEVRPGADLGEVYYSDDKTIAPGEVIAIAGTSEDKIRRATPETGAIGVVSTRPGQLLSDAPKDGGVAVIVALSGRVPVKVSAENGVIHAGDALTVSRSKPGYAMKATESGSMIGRALSGFEPPENAEPTGLVMMFVQNGYYIPSVANSDLNTLAAHSNDILVSSPSVVVTEPTEHQGELVVLKHFYQGEDAAGFAKILAGSQTVEVKFREKYLYPPVITLTAYTEVPGGYWIEKSTEDGFVIRLTQPVNERDSLISWAVTAVKEPVLYVSDGTFGKLHEEDSWRGLGAPVVEPDPQSSAEVSSVSTSETGLTEPEPSSSTNENVSSSPSSPEEAPFEASAASSDASVLEVVE